MEITLIKCDESLSEDKKKYIHQLQRENKLSTPHRSLFVGENIDALSYVPKDFGAVVLATHTEHALDEIFEIPEYYNKPAILTVLAESHIVYNTKLSKFISKFLSDNAYLNEAQSLRYFTAIQEVVLNAIEHGNLKLTEQKKEVIQKDVWFDKFRDLVGNSLSDLKNASKLVLVKIYLDYERKSIVTMVKDEGSGFEVEDVMNVSEENTKAHGRGLGLLKGLTDECKFTLDGRCSEFLFNAEYLRAGLLHDENFGADFMKEAGKILVVDDQLTNLEIVSYYLKSAGYKQVFKAMSGKEAIEIAMETNPDIILMDVIMPEMDGFVASRHIKLIESLKNTPILFLTAQSKNENRIQGYQSGAVDYVIKPVEKEELLARTQTHLQNSLFMKSLRQNLKRIQNDLERAKVSQLDLLPSSEDLEVLEMKYDLSVKTYFEPCEELAGDYFSVEEVEAGCVLMTSADFTGHGIAASLNTIRLHSLMGEARHFLPNLEKFVLFLNDRLKFTLSVQDFASFVCLLLDTNTGGIRYIGCGSPPIVVIPADKTKNCYALPCEGLPLGLVDSNKMQLELREAHLCKGDSIFLFSDGLIESKHKETGDMWGCDGLLSILDCLNKNNTFLDLCDVKDEFLKSVAMPLKDDLTMLFLTYKSDVASKELLHSYMSPDGFVEELES